MGRLGPGQGPVGLWEEEVTVGAGKLLKRPKLELNPEHYCCEGHVAEIKHFRTILHLFRITLNSHMLQFILIFRDETCWCSETDFPEFTE